MNQINKIVFATITKGNHSTFKVLTASDGKQVHSFDCTDENSMMFLLLTLSNQHSNAAVQKTTVANGVTTKVIIKVDMQQEDNRTAEEVFQDAFNNVNEESFVDEDIEVEKDIQFESPAHYPLSEDDNQQIIQAFTDNNMFSNKFIHNQSDDAMVVFNLITSGRYSFLGHYVNETILSNDVELLKQGKLTSDICIFILLEANVSKSERRAILKEIKMNSVRHNNQQHAKANQQA